MRGPVATMTAAHSAGGRPATSSRAIVIERMRVERGGHGGGEPVPVDRERAAGRHLMRVAFAHDERAERRIS